MIDTSRGDAIDHAIREARDHYDWRVHALDVRTNHLHLVVSLADKPPGEAMRLLKAHCTRSLRTLGLANADERLWTRHGSTRYLWDRRSFDGAIQYVLHEQ